MFDRQQLRKLRESFQREDGGRGLTRPALERRTERFGRLVSRDAIEAYEMGERMPRFDSAAALARALGVSIAALDRSS